MRSTLAWAVAILALAGLAAGACTSFGEEDGPGTDAGTATDATGSEGGPGTLDGTLPPQKLNIQLDPAKAVVARKGSTLVKVAIAVGGTSATIRLEAPQGSGLTAAPQTANGAGAAVLEIKASDKAVTKTDQKVKIVVEGADGVSRGEAVLDLEVRGAPGELDDSFGVGGIAKIELGADTVMNGDMTALPGPAGELMIGATDTGGPFVTILDQQGEVVTSYGVLGKCRFAGISASPGHVQVLRNLAVGTIAAVFDGINTTAMFRADRACGNPYVRFNAIPSTRMAGISQLASRRGSLMALGAQGGRWVIESGSSVSNELDQNWGVQGRVSGIANSGVGVGFFEGATEDVGFLDNGESWYRQQFSKSGALGTSSPLSPGMIMGFGSSSGTVEPVTYNTATGELAINTPQSRKSRLRVALMACRSCAVETPTGHVAFFSEDYLNGDAALSFTRVSRAGDVDTAFGTQGTVRLTPSGSIGGHYPTHVLEIRGKLYALAFALTVPRRSALVFRLWL